MALEREVESLQKENDRIRRPKPATVDGFAWFCLVFLFLFFLNSFFKIAFPRGLLGNLFLHIFSRLLKQIQACLPGSVNFG